MRFFAWSGGTLVRLGQRFGNETIGLRYRQYLRMDGTSAGRAATRQLMNVLYSRHRLVSLNALQTDLLNLLTPGAQSPVAWREKVCKLS
jgi:hypothetical protein